MYFYLEYGKDGLVKEYSKTEFPFKDKALTQVSEHDFKLGLASIGLDYQSTEDKIAELQTENANLILENIAKEIKLEALEAENANLLLAAAEQDLRLVQAESDIASLMLELGGM